jgi:hypothetical protein
MKTLIGQILPRLEEKRLSVDLGPGNLYPAYDGLSIANLPASILGWLGVEQLPTAAPPLDAAIRAHWAGEFRHVVMLVVDGLGLDILQGALSGDGGRHLDGWGDLPADALLAPLTSIVPSTTAAALTTFWTGAPPGAHGVVGYTQYLKEYGLIANMILHNPATFSGDPGSLRHAGFNSETFVSLPMLGQHLKSAGVRVYAGQHRSIAKSGLSTMLFPGVEVGALYTLGDLFVTLSEKLDAASAAPGERAYTYLYWGELDDLAHRYGPDSERYRRELYDFTLQFSLFLRERAGRRRGDTLFLLTADHGHIVTPPDPHLEIRRHPVLMDCLSLLPCGEARLPYIYLRPGREQRFLELIETIWPGRFRALRGAECIQAGLFAPARWPLHPGLEGRVGDFILVPQAHSDYLWFDLLKPNPLRGRHGGLSRTEMLVPLLGFTL